MTTPSRWPPQRPSDPPASPAGLGYREPAGLPAPRLWRSRTDRVVAGVLGGLAERFGLDSRPVRILYALLSVASAGLLVIPYVGLWAITRPRGPAPPGPRFWRSPTRRLVAGVLGGLAEKMGLPPALVRVAYVALSVATGGFPGVLAYLALWAVTRPYGDSPA